MSVALVRYVNPAHHEPSQLLDPTVGISSSWGSELILRREQAISLTTLTLEGWNHFMTTKVAATMPAIPQVTPEMLPNGCGRGELIEGSYYLRGLTAVWHEYVPHALRQVGTDRI